MNRALMTSTLVLLLVCSSRAADIATSGAVELIDPPSDVRTGKFEDDDRIHVFVEQTGLRLERAMPADIKSPGTSPILRTYRGKKGKERRKLDANLSPGQVSSGSVIDSYFIHFDPVGGGKESHTRTGSVTFPGRILGVIVSEKKLSDTHPLLGRPDTAYPTGSAQDVEFRDGTSITLTSDRKTLKLKFVAGLRSDSLRVITEAAPDKPDDPPEVQASSDAEPDDSRPGGGTGLRRGRRGGRGNAAPVDPNDPLPVNSRWVGSRTDSFRAQEVPCEMEIVRREGNLVEVQMRERHMAPNLGIRWTFALNRGALQSTGFRQTSGHGYRRNGQAAGRVAGRTITLEYYWDLSGKKQANNPVRGMIQLQRID